MKGLIKETLLIITNKKSPAPGRNRTHYLLIPSACFTAVLQLRPGFDMSYSKAFSFNLKLVLQWSKLFWKGWTRKRKAAYFPGQANEEMIYYFIFKEKKEAAAAAGWIVRAMVAWPNNCCWKGKRDDNNSLDHSTSCLLLTSRLDVASSFIVRLTLPRSGGDKKTKRRQEG